MFKFNVGDQVLIGTKNSFPNSSFTEERKEGYSIFNNYIGIIYSCSDQWKGDWYQTYDYLIRLPKSSDIWNCGGHSCIYSRKYIPFFLKIHQLQFYFRFCCEENLRPAK